MAEDTGSRRRQRATDSKQRLFDASMQLLGTRGPDAVTVEEIAGIAGVSKGTVYYNFGSKDGMISQMLSYGSDLLMADLHAAASEPDPQLALRQMMLAAMDFVGRYPSFAQVMLTEQLNSSTSWGEQLMALHGQVAELIISLLERLVVLSEEEKLPAATAMFGAAAFTARMHATGRLPGDSEAAVSMVLNLVHGLLATHQKAA